MPSLFSPWHFVIRKQGVKHSRVRLGAAVHPTDRIYCKLVYIQCVRLLASMCKCMRCRLLFIQTNINLNDWHLLERTCCSLEYFVFVELYVCCHCCNCFFFCCCCRFLICIYLVTPRTKGKETKAWNQPTKSSKHLTNANLYVYLPLLFLLLLLSLFCHPNWLCCPQSWCHSPNDSKHNVDLHFAKGKMRRL